MSHRKIGALPYQTILEMIDAGCLPGSNPENVQPASIDLSVTSEVYRMPGIVQPKVGERVKELILRIGGEKHNFKFPLEVNVAYIAKLKGKARLPEGIYGYCNPKSTTGRLDVHVRVVADGVARYDALYPKGFSGDLWISIVAKSFPIKLFKGISLTQLRLFSDDTRLDELELQLALQKHQLLWNRSGKALKYGDITLSDKDGSMMLTADLENNNVGWECIQPGKVLDLSLHNYNPSDFFKRVELVNGHLHLTKDRFYILSTKEFVRVPPGMACEMRPMDDRSGEFRAHYAGFIDPGWGWGKEGEEKGRPLTLEVRPHENMIFGQDQAIAKIRFEMMKEVPETLYDAGSSNYSVQNGPRLSKHFAIT